MQKPSKILVPLAIVLGVIVLGVLIGWLGGKNSGSPVIAPPARTPGVQTSGNSSTGNPAGTSPAQPDNTGLTPPLTADPAHPGAAAGTLTNWEEKVDEILGAETDDTNKVQQLFALFPAVPDEAKSEVAQHLSNLTSDALYAPLGELLKDGKLPDAALDVLMSDALNRANSVKLPELLEVAKTPDHPKAQEAKDILALFLDEDFGTDWTKWQEKMAAWLKDNPD